MSAQHRRVKVCVLEPASRGLPNARFVGFAFWLCVGTEPKFSCIADPNYSLLRPVVLGALQALTPAAASGQSLVLGASGAHGLCQFL